MTAGHLSSPPTIIEAARLLPLHDRDLLRSTMITPGAEGNLKKVLSRERSAEKPVALHNYSANGRLIP
jgi:hypothetical protein